MEKMIERILKLSNEKNINGTQMAKLLELKKTPLTDWKNEKSKPTIEQLIILCDFFAVSLDFLVLGHEINKGSFSLSTISEKEKFLLDGFNDLNKQGQDYILQTLDLAKIRYKKDICAGNMEAI